MSKPIVANSFTPNLGKIFVTDLEKGMQKTKGGIILRDDNMKEEGIKARWCRIWKVGSDVTFVKPGEWVLVEHGRWTQRIAFDLPTENVVVWMVDPAAILVAYDGEESPAKTDLFVIEG